MSAVIDYNVAMANRVAGLVENNRSLDALADDLLVSPAVMESAPSASSVFDSAGFSRIVSALQARLVEGACSDAIAAHIVDGYDLGGLQPAEIEAFETQGEDPVAHLVRAAVTLALTVRHGTACTPELRELEIDPSHLRHDWRRELAREMAVRAQKLLAETRYVEASALSGLRAKNLAVVSTVPREPARGDRSSATATAQPSAPESRFGLGLGSTLLRLLMAGGGVLVLALLFSSL
jgi:hypothetical protein